MRLTKEETEAIDKALEALKRSLKDEVRARLAREDDERMDDAFLQKIADSYLSVGGILCLLKDAHFLRDECGGPCHITCVNPAKVACWNAGTVL